MAADHLAACMVEERVDAVAQLATHASVERRVGDARDARQLADAIDEVAARVRVRDARLPCDAGAIGGAEPGELPEELVDDVKARPCEETDREDLGEG